ncbi:MAG: HPr kinase/phosphorylase [Bacillales bacterium]|jgi:HPr kinase/phosphorylase|nr:HPr kinase/phosphorylase [Bacillales bacterium]
MSKVTISDVINKFNFEVVSGEEGISKPVLKSDLSRPGLVMAGFDEYYPAKRIQILGKTELTFFAGLNYEDRQNRMSRLCQLDTPGIIVTRGLDVPEELIIASEYASVPVMKTPAKSSRIESKLTNYLEYKLAPTTAVHGVLIDIYGVGVLITGQSGVGKSETALELVKRGHRLVADDCVEIHQEEDDKLVGHAPELIAHLLEIRGLGIINVMTLFGAGAVRTYKQISLIINLENWDPNKVYDRLGLDEQYVKIIDTEIPKMVVPVRPGRNLAIIVEVAAMNFRLKKLGVNAAEQFANKLTDVIEDAEREL